MKKLLVVCSLVVMLVGFTAFNVAALPLMQGGISFSGDYALDTGNILTANAFTSFSNVVVQSGSGTWSGVPANTPAAFVPFTFNPPTNAVPLWWFFFGGITYQLNAPAGSMSFTREGGAIPALDVEGAGSILASANYDPTPGFYKITANQGATTFSFSASSVTTPEPGTLLLLGLGLVGLVGAGRKFKK
jgi:hypothetical protein